MKLHRVCFNSEGDGVTALYINGGLHTYGDYYHNKIDDWINGFIAGLEFAEVKFELDEHHIPGDDCRPIHEDGNPPPEKWPDRKYYKKRIVHE